jgi:hypothetical protein
VLPNSNYPHSTLYKRPVAAPIPLPIPLELGCPEFTSGFRRMPTQAAAMPEAPINEDRDLLFVEKEIRFPKLVTRVEPPTADSTANQGHPQSRFCASVAFAFYTPHNMGTSWVDISECSVLQQRFKVSLH